MTDLNDTLTRAVDTDLATDRTLDLDLTAVHRRVRGRRVRRRIGVTVLGVAAVAGLVPLLGAVRGPDRTRPITASNPTTSTTAPPEYRHEPTVMRDVPPPSVDELWTAHLQLRSCLESGGFAVSGPWPHPFGDGIGYEVAGTPGGPALDPQNSCENAVASMNLAFAEHGSEHDRAVLRKQFEAYASCLGVTSPDPTQAFRYVVSEGTVAEASRRSPDLGLGCAEQARTIDVTDTGPTDGPETWDLSPGWDSFADQCTGTFTILRFDVTDETGFVWQLRGARCASTGEGRIAMAPADETWPPVDGEARLLARFDYVEKTSLELRDVVTGGRASALDQTCRIVIHINDRGRWSGTLTCQPPS